MAPKRVYQTPYGPMSEEQVMQIKMAQEMERRGLTGSPKTGYTQAGAPAGAAPGAGGGAGKALGGLAALGGTIGGYKLANMAFGGGSSTAPTAAGGASTPSSGGFLSNLWGSGGSSSAPSGGQAVGSGALGAGAVGAQAAGAGTFSSGAALAGEGGAQLLSGTGTMGGSGALGMTGASPLLGGAGIAAGAYTGMEQGKGLYNAVKGKDLSLTEQAALALPTFGLSFAANPIRRMLGSRKGKEQLARDSVRKGLKESGFIDEGYNVDLADGSKFNIGKDGGEPLYNTDFSKEGADEAIGDVNVLAHLLTGGDKKLRSDFAGYLSNAVMASGDRRENARALFGKAGLDHAKAYGAIDQDQTLDQATKDAYKNGLDSLFGVGAYAGGKNPTATGKLPVGKPLPQQGKPMTQALVRALAGGVKPLPAKLQGKPMNAVNAFTAPAGVALSALRR